jgi:ribosome recycling factor
MGLNPATSGELIRIPMPALTEERRRDLIKVVKSEGENAKISIRNIRRDSNEASKKMAKDKEISEDDERGMQENVQKITDEFIVEVDRLIDAKEKDLLVI